MYNQYMSVVLPERFETNGWAVLNRPYNPIQVKGEVCVFQNQNQEQWRIELPDAYRFDLVLNAIRGPSGQVFKRQELFYFPTWQDGPRLSSDLTDIPNIPEFKIALYTKFKDIVSFFPNFLTSPNSVHPQIFLTGKTGIFLGQQVYDPYGEFVRSGLTF